MEELFRITGLMKKGQTKRWDLERLTTIKRSSTYLFTVTVKAPGMPAKLWVCGPKVAAEKLRQWIR